MSGERERLADRLRRLVTGPGRGPARATTPPGDLDAETGEEVDEAAIEERVGQLAREIFARHGIDEDEVPADPAFGEAVELLTSREVSFDTVASVARDPWGIPLRAIGLEAAAWRADAPAEWVEWALGRMQRAHTLELMFLLRAVYANALEPVVARVLGRADFDWCYDPNLGRLTQFVRDRVEHGEVVEAGQFEGVDRQNLENLANVVAALEGAVPADVVAAYRRWHETRVDTDLLREFATLWELPPPGEPPHLAGERALVVEAIASALDAVPRRSLLLVGEHGVGKSALLREALRRIDTSGWVVFEAGAANVLAGQSFIGQLEGRVQSIVDQARGRPVVWVLPNVAEALHAGQHSRSPQGLLDALLPHVEAGELTIVGELEPAALELLLKERPRVASAFTAIRVAELDEHETLSVARAWADAAAVTIDDDALAEANELSEHYLSGIARPGALIRLLRAARLRRLADDPAAPVTIDGDAVVETLADATGLPLEMLDPRSALDLEDVRAFLSRRVLGQPEAVDALVERVALIKSGLTDSTRPLGVFLFVGPTGTGKTELAKAVAEYVFGSAERLVRLDMSEFQTPESLERLLADRTSEPQAAPLIAAVRRDPFSVVLLDEFEKAHGNIWDVFLALFDDGRLTDRSGATADFRHCLVILTSNIGSAIAGPGAGFARIEEPFQPQAVERAVTQSFRPELLNRLDRVVVFRPLGRDDMRTLLEHELRAVMERRGLRSRGWVAEWDEAALDLLLDRGFSRELGARPLKRAVEQHILAPLAVAIVGREVPEGDQFLFITTRGNELEVTFVDPDAPEDVAQPESPPARELTLEQIVADARGDAAELAFLRGELGRVRAEHWSVRKDELLERTRAEGFWEDDDRQAVLATVEVLDRAETMTRSATGLLERLGRDGTAGGNRAYLAALLAERLYLLARAQADVEAGGTGDAFLTIRPASTGSGSSEQFAGELQAMYEAWAERRRMTVTPLTGGIFAVAGLGAHAILAPEAGLHVLEVPADERSFDRVTAHVGVAPWPTGTAPGAGLGEAARAALAATPVPQQVVRRYRREPSPLVRDTVRGRTGRLDRVLGGEFDVVP